MNEVIRSVETPVLSHGVAYHAQVCGRQRADEMWEAWVEFVPLAGGEAPCHTPRETTQPDREALRYWAFGLSSVYLEGALHRALEAAAPRQDVTSVEPRAIFESPARRP